MCSPTSSSHDWSRRHFVSNQVCICLLTVVIIHFLMKKVGYTSRVQSHLKGGLNLHRESLDDWFPFLCLIEFPGERRKVKE